jgi:hypothetical protein
VRRRRLKEDLMATFAEHNFGNDGAMDYLSMLITQLVATVSAIVADDTRLALDEDGETMLMPSVEVLAFLCERYNAVPPRAETVRQWADKYLGVYDRTIDRLRPRPGFKAARRKVIEKTFRWLESLAETYHDQ